MKFYLDSARIDEIEKATSFGYIQGVTTNPTLLKRVEVWRDFKSLGEFYLKVMRICDGEVFVQVPSENSLKMLNEIKNLDDSRLVIKVPSVPKGLKIAKELVDKGYSVCATAVYTTSQAIMWSSLGADYVAVYVNRMEKKGFETFKNIKAIVKALSKTQTKVLAASVKTVEQLSSLVDVGVDYVTLDYNMIDGITKCDFSIQDTKTFDNDFEEMYERFKEK